MQAPDWTRIDWTQKPKQIAILLGVTTNAVRYQARKRGIVLPSPKRGRKVKRTTKNKRLAFVVSDAMEKRIAKAAKEKGVSVSRWLRDIVGAEVSPNFPKGQATESILLDALKTIANNAGGGGVGEDGEVWIWDAYALQEVAQEAIAEYEKAMTQRQTWTTSDQWKDEIYKMEAVDVTPEREFVIKTIDAIKAAKDARRVYRKMSRDINAAFKNSNDNQAITNPKLHLL